jgi:hypothetical protein
MQTYIDGTGVTRADIARYNNQTLCTQYIDVAVVNSAAAI